ncbi:MAG: ribonuclease P protein component [Acaryochloris sp. RU_4_1]|nr:ribonuclease P protein component [Acaryochloris sp. RU_4_1]NJR53433.1 ribonuclease P protein component [Acaryochloris sp. CRU_2_0]
MLSKPHRLTCSQDFVTVYRLGKRCSCSALVLRAYQHRPVSPADPHPTRIGFSISHKVSKQAVVRNRIKRQLRVVCYQLLPNLQPGWDVVVVVRSAAVRCDYWQFLQQLRKLFAEVEILNGY